MTTELQIADFNHDTLFPTSFALIIPCTTGSKSPTHQFLASHNRSFPLSWGYPTAGWFLLGTIPNGWWFTVIHPWDPYVCHIYIWSHWPSTKTPSFLLASIYHDYMDPSWVKIVPLFEETSKCRLKEHPPFRCFDDFASAGFSWFKWRANAIWDQDQPFWRAWNRWKHLKKLGTI